jgi:purine nucleoside phosphorylase
VGARLGLEVAAISCVTNFATGLAPRPLTHEEVTEMGDRLSSSVRALLGDALRSLE